MEKVIITKELLDEIIEYVEQTEETIEGEWGDGKRVSEIIRDGGMPELYDKLIKLRDNDN